MLASSWGFQLQYVDGIWRKGAGETRAQSFDPGCYWHHFIRVFQRIGVLRLPGGEHQQRTPGGDFFYPVHCDGYRLGRGVQINHLQINRSVFAAAGGAVKEIGRLHGHARRHHRVPAMHLEHLLRVIRGRGITGQRIVTNEIGTMDYKSKDITIYKSSICNQMARIKSERD